MRSFVFAALATVLGSLAAPARGQSQVLMSENFESGAPGWTFSNGANGLWRLAANGNCEAVTTVAAYNRLAACDYNTGGGNNGELISPPVVLSGQAPFLLSFTSRRDMDVAADTACVRVRVQGSPTWEALFCELDNSDSYQPGDLLIPPAYNGLTIEVGFRVTANNIGNNKLGWLLDDIGVRNSGPPIEPTITNVSPPFGPNSGINGVVITGTNFTGTSVVTFGSTPATFTVNSATQITADIGATAELGYEDVSVTAFGGTVIAPASFDFFVAPTVIGNACGDPYLSWSGSPTLGKDYIVTTEHLGFGSQVLLIERTNGVPVSPFQRVLWTQRGTASCPILVRPSDTLKLGGITSHTFAIPNDSRLLGTTIRTQAIVRLLGGQVVATQAIEATIGE